MTDGRENAKVWETGEGSGPTGAGWWLGRWRQSQGWDAAEHKLALSSPPPHTLLMSARASSSHQKLPLRQGFTGGIPAELNTSTTEAPAANGNSAHGRHTQSGSGEAAQLPRTSYTGAAASPLGPGAPSATGRTASQAPPQLLPQPSGYHTLPQPIPLSIELLGRGGAAAAAAADDDLRTPGIGAGASLSTSGADNVSVAAGAADGFTPSQSQSKLATAGNAAGEANGHLHHHHHQHSSTAALASANSVFSSNSALSTTISLYPTERLDVFQPVYGCPRSGAFAVHGREPRGVGLSRLVTAYATCHSLPAPEQVRATAQGRCGT